MPQPIAHPISAEPPDGLTEPVEDAAEYARRYFDAVSPFYDDLTEAEGSGWNPNRVLAEVLGPLLRPGMVALDVGAGTGQTVAVLCTVLDPGNVTAIDVSEGMLDRLRERFPAVRAEPQTVEAFAAAKPAARFDLVTCVGTLEFVRDSPSFLRVCAKLLRPRGLLAVTYMPVVHFLEAASDRVYREPGAFAAELAEAGFALNRDVELVAYREAGEPVLYHMVVANRRRLRWQHHPRPQAPTFTMSEGMSSPKATVVSDTQRVPSPL